MGAAKRPTMVLPEHDRASGQVAADWLGRDLRVPVPLRDRSEDYFRGDHPPRVFGFLERPAQCPDGRHLVDIIESVIEHEIEDDDASRGYRYEQEFRTCLTCVRCGLVTQWDGRRQEHRRGHVDPAPLVAGDLVAQQTSGADDWGTKTYRVLRGSENAGTISASRGSRGRRFYVGRFDQWAVGEHVEGPDPAAVLRKLSRGARAPHGVARGSVSSVG